MTLLYLYLQQPSYIDSIRRNARKRQTGKMRHAACFSESNRVCIRRIKEKTSEHTLLLNLLTTYTHTPIQVNRKMSGMKFLDVNAQLPDELVPFADKLGPNFMAVRKKVVAFAIEECLPMVPRYTREMEENVKKVGDPLLAPQPPCFKELQQKAKDRGLWNFFLFGGGGLSNLEYAPIAEILGSVPLVNAAMNCSAPDTGNMEIIHKFGTPEQKKRWLEPLMNGEIRSAYAMTEPGVASSDATNISTRIEADGDDYVINGHKWWISGAVRPECKLLVVMGKTRFDGPRHRQQSMILVPKDHPGVKIVRALSVFGHRHDHAEIVFDNVRVPKTSILLGEGRGFDIAQARLGPGRIHHCMRTIGSAEIALEAIVHRAHSRKAFGKLIKDHQSIQQVVALARIEITQVRLLCYLAAVMADQHGFKAARKYIAMIKYAAPKAALKIVDEAMQVHGAHGVGPDSGLSSLYANLRTLRVADGPDIVHLQTVAKMEINKQVSPMGRRMSGENKNIVKYDKFSHVPDISYANLAPHLKTKL
jgi:acyl-CoA dehydrogenase